MLPPEGGWVRCTRCQEVFLAERDAPQLDLDAVSFSEEEESRPPHKPDTSFLDRGPLAGFDLIDEEASAKGKKGIWRFFFFLLLLLIFLPALALGSLLALDRFNLMPQMLEPLREIPGLNLVLGKSASVEGGLSLNNVRSYYRDNQHAGRILVIQGEVRNTSDYSLVRVLVTSRVYDIRNNPVSQVTIYAGPVFTMEQLWTLTVQEFHTLLSRPQNSQGILYELLPQGTLPFMIVMANLPDNIADYTVDVEGWENRASGGR
jgi:hypothetical protein